MALIEIPNRHKRFRRPPIVHSESIRVARQVDPVLGGVSR